MCIRDREKTARLAQLTSPLDIWDLDLLPEVHQTLDRISFSGEWMNAWQKGALRSSEFDYPNVVSNAEVPVLLLHGEMDMRFPVGVTTRLAVAAPKVQHVVIASAGHLTHIEKNEAWIESIERFVASTKSSA